MRAKARRLTAACVGVVLLAAGAGPSAREVTHHLAFVPGGLSAPAGLVRVANQSERAGEVRIEGWDDRGARYGPVVLEIGAREAVRLNSYHLAAGNPGRGLAEGLGRGARHWSLAVSSDLDLEVAAYVRGRGGILAPVHDMAPAGPAGRYRVTVPEGGRRVVRHGLVRIVNPGDETVEVRIEARDDRGLPAGVRSSFELGPREARFVSARGFGNGAGGSGEVRWWRVEVSAERPLWVLGLVRDATGALANVSTAAPPGPDLRVRFVGCEAPEGFHGYLARGAAEAGADFGVEVRYVYPAERTSEAQVALVDEAIEDGVDGVALCAYLGDRAYEAVAGRAARAGVVLGSAAGPRPAARLRPETDPFLFRVGSDERAAGEVSARRLLGLGVRGRVVLVNHRPDDVTCAERAASQAHVLRTEGVEVTLVARELDPAGQAEALRVELARYPRPAAATAVCAAPDPLLEAKAAAGADRLVVTGFDLLGASIAAIRDGRQAFTVDQQQFWRGYVPVMLLAHHLRYGLVQTNYFLTGPRVVDRWNVEEVAALVERGYR